jgi:hypothetical protein
MRTRHRLRPMFALLPPPKDHQRAAHNQKRPRNATHHNDRDLPFSAASFYRRRGGGNCQDARQHVDVVPRAFAQVPSAIFCAVTLYVMLMLLGTVVHVQFSKLRTLEYCLGEQLENRCTDTEKEITRLLPTTQNSSPPGAGAYVRFPRLRNSSPDATLAATVSPDTRSVRRPALIPSAATGVISPEKYAATALTLSSPSTEAL